MPSIDVDTDAAFRAADRDMTVQTSAVNRMKQAGGGARRIIAGPNETDTQPDDNGVMHMNAPFSFIGTWKSEGDDGEASGARVLLEGDADGPRSWTTSEIEQMSSAEFEQHADEINKAMSEGRVVEG